MNPVFAGYFAKRTERQTEWLKVPQVEEIASVSPCISEVPPEWLDYWLHNEIGFYNSEELALSVVPPDEQSEYDLYAYAVFPVRFDQGREESYSIPVLEVDPLPASYTKLGYDAVSREVWCPYFGHSPLSCNYMAQEVEVNRYCLVDTQAQAFELPRRFWQSNCEPGPYYVVEVWRKA